MLKKSGQTGLAGFFQTLKMLWKSQLWSCQYQLLLLFPLHVVDWGSVAQLFNNRFCLFGQRCSQIVWICNSLLLLFLEVCPVTWKILTLHPIYDRDSDQSAPWFSLVYYVRCLLDDGQLRLLMAWGLCWVLLRRWWQNRRRATMGLHIYGRGSVAVLV